MARRLRGYARIDHLSRAACAACGVVLAAVLTVGCGRIDEPGVPAPERSGPVYPTVGAGDVVSAPVGERPGGDDHDDGRPPAAPPPAAQAAPVAAAFAAAWARPDLPAQTWWRGVSSSCDAGFARALRSVDPARVPATRVTGRPVATQAPTGGRAVFEVATDAGTLIVTLAGVGGRWVVTDNDFRRAVSQ